MMTVATSCFKEVIDNAIDEFIMGHGKGSLD